METAAGATGELRVREVACVNAARTLLCVELGDHSAPGRSRSWRARTATNRPVRGRCWNSPNPTLSIRSLPIGLWPCVNPTGYDARTRASADGSRRQSHLWPRRRSPEAKAILTANRDRKFALSLDLHEDCDAAGFYCYEYGGGEIGRAVVAALDAAGLPVDPLEATFATAGPLDDAACRRERGRIA